MMRSLVFLTVLLLTAAANAQPPLGIGTNPQGTLTYRLGATVAAAIEKSTEMRAQVQPGSSTSVLVPLINSGELDFGFVNSLEILEAHGGTGSFGGRPNKNLRVLAVLFPISVGLFVREDSPVKTIADLKGRRIPHGFTSQQIIATLNDGILANGGLSRDDVKTVLVPNLIRGVDEFIAGNADVGFFAMGQAKVAEADAAVGGIRFLPMGDSPAAVKRMQQIAPGSYIDSVKPAKHLVGVKQPLKTMHYDYVMFASTQMSDETAYKLTKLLVDQQQALGEGMPLFRQLDPKRMHQADLGAPYHDGALRYYREQNLLGSK